MSRKKTAQLKGDVFLLSDRAQSFAAAQIELLGAIAECGSISQAAKQLGISYKTAWDRIDAMNNMSSRALVARSAGGARGGGTTLTAFGQRVLAGFQSLQSEHARFVEQLGDRLHSLNDVADFVRLGALKTSARNQFRGFVARLTPGSVNTEVEVDVGAGQPLVAIITRDSAKHLGLARKRGVVALIKASSVIVSTDPDVATSARNKLVGTVARVTAGAINSEVVIDIGGGKSVCAIITNTSAEALKLAGGQTACALFKASSVILLREA